MIWLGSNLLPQWLRGVLGSKRTGITGIKKEWRFWNRYWRRQLRITGRTSSNCFDIQQFSGKELSNTVPAERVVRIGFITAKKVFGKKAVDRNRARRRLREAARLHLVEHLDHRQVYIMRGRQALTSTTYQALSLEMHIAGEELKFQNRLRLLPKSLRRLLKRLHLISKSK